MLYTVFGYLIFVALIVLVAKSLDRNPWIWGGLAVLTTSITISLGFSILFLSSFIPTAIFGIFTSIAMIFAMIGVLLVLPSLLILVKNDN